MSAEYETRFEQDDTPREECGIFAVIRLDGEPDPTMADKAYRGLSGLQHRGEDAAGITVYARKTRYKFHTYKDQGLISSVFANGANLKYLPAESSLALAHTRYSTAGKSGDAAEKARRAHPHSSKRFDYMIAANGHMKQMEKAGKSESDIENLVDVIDARMTETGEDLKASLLAILGQLDGGYGLIASDGNRLIAARDPWGLRPLVHATDGTYHYFSSEDSALRIPSIGIGYGEVEEVPPGVMFTITPGEEIERDNIYPEPVAETALCSMESAYFARADSTMAGRNVQEVRFNIGRLLAEQEADGFDADIVIGVPDSGSDSAVAYAEVLGIPCRRAILKNAYIGRTFIQESQEARIDAAWLKFRVNPTLVEGKSVVVVDDSIVRGTNSKVIVQMLRQAGATEVHLRAGFPKHRFSCVYGIDTGNPAELIANRMNDEEICKHLNIDSLGYITPENLRQAISPKIGGICMACVTGEYPTAGRTTELPLPVIPRK